MQRHRIHFDRNPGPHHLRWCVTTRAVVAPQHGALDGARA